MLNDGNRVKEIFLEAAEQPDEAACAAYLDHACGDDAGLRDRVEALLRSHDPAGSFLDNPAVKPPEENGATQELGVDKGATPDDDANGADDLPFLSPSTRPDSLGRLGHYEMLQVLGKGGFGIVFRAFDETLQRVVAVKVMAPQIATLSPARKRFLREARSSAAVRHENVVQIYEVGEQPLPYLAMEFIPGETLQQKLDRSGPLEVSEVLRIGRQIAEGLAAAHACDLIHRDIKPGNILLEGGSHKAKITDFGLARAADDASISQSGLIAGTPMYMAPEQALGHKLDQRADLFSLGSVLYQMASGRPPFRAPSALAVLKRVAEEPPRPIPEIIPETPDWLCGIITKLHAKNPDDRFQSAREVADLLGDCEAKLKAKQEVKNVLPAAIKPTGSTRRKWIAAAAVLLLSVIALAVTEFAGLTHWFRGSTPTADPDRKAAEYVLSIGGQVQVDGRDHNLNAATELPRDPFRLTWVGLMHSNQLSETGLANFKDCQNLTFLGLFDTSVSDEGLANFQNCTKLTFLNLSRTKISDAGLASFKNCTELTAVVLSETKVSDAGLDYLKNSKKLTKLFLQKTKVTAAGIDELKKALPLCKIEWDRGVSQLLPPTFTNSIGMEFVIVPKGKSWLGGGKDKLGDQEVEIPAGFYLGKYEVTQEEWEKVMGENPSWFSRTGGGMDAVKDIPDADLKRFPVESVSWDNCQLFVANLNKLEKETGWVYRLPTAVEWEYACRGGPMVDKADSAFDFYFARPANTLAPEQANFKDGGLNRTCRVGSYEPNALGLYDMHGNVWEWCNELFDTNDPAKASFRVTRGNSYCVGSECSRAANYWASPPSGRNTDLGLRLARVPSGAPSPEAKTPPLAVAPFTDADVQRIAALPAAEQVEEVRKELMHRNPGFDGKLEHKIEDGVVTEFRIVTDHVTDIAPIRVWNSLRVLDCSGTWTNKANGLLADLTPLEGMNLAGLTHLGLGRTKVTDAGMAHFKDCKDLTALYLDGTKVTDAGMVYFKDCKDLTSLRLDATKVTDRGLVHFQDCKDMSYLNLAYTQVSDAGLAYFKDCKNLRELILNYTQTSDAGLTQLKGMALRKLAIRNTGVTDLTSLQGMPLEGIHLTLKNITQGLDILRDMKSLKTIGIDDNQTLPAAEFWERYDKGEFSSLAAATPFTDADAQRIAALPAEQQVEEVRKELMQRNPGFDGKMEYKIEDGVVTELKIVTDKVTDIAPIRVFNALRVLNCRGTPTPDWKGGNGLLADLTPLKGMSFTHLAALYLDWTKVDDVGLAYFKDCKNLRILQLYRTSVSDAGLTHFKDCKNLTQLCLWGEKVSDVGVAYFKDCKDLTWLKLEGTQVSDAGLACFEGCKNLTALNLAASP